MEPPPTNGNGAAQPVRRQLKEPPEKTWTVAEASYPGFTEIDNSGYKKSSSETTLVIDNGSSAVRAGWSFDSKPRMSYAPQMAKYKDRKLNRHFMFIGKDVYADGTARGQAKSVYEPGSNVVNNWDVMEGVLDYIFVKMGLDSSHVDRPVLMTEPLANLAYPRKTMTEILFECYRAPSIAFGIDSLFSYSYNDGKTGLVISSSNSSTHLIPVIDTTPLLAHATRLNWGRFHSADYLLRQLKIKHPSVKVSEPQIAELARQHCYVSQSYDRDTDGWLDWTGLEDRNHIVQFPFTEHVVVQKTEEELARAAEKARENGRRLAEQAAKMRLEKLMQKERDLEYYKELQEKITNTTKKEAKRLLEIEDFDDETQLDKKIKDLDKNIRKAQKKDLGEIEEVEEPTFPLLEIPDDQLDEESLKQKKAQKLMKANHLARARAKAEKEREKARIAEIERLDVEKRETDLDGWLEERRASRLAIVQTKKERDRLKAEMGNRKSLANQMRMKSIANLASDNPVKKRRRGGDEDTFGADDADWMVYRQIADKGEGSDDEDEEDLDTRLKRVEEELLQYDPFFTEENTFDSQSDWTNSLLHSYFHGPYPFDPESQRDIHQLHLNVERIRVPEIIFQPSIAGLDQAGVGEIACDIFTQRLIDPVLQSCVMKDIFLTGGNTLFQGFEQRLQSELRSMLKATTKLSVRSARDPTLDAWRGAAQWAGQPAAKPHFVSREEYLESGPDYFKEHRWGNQQPPVKVEF